MLDGIIKISAKKQPRYSLDGDCNGQEIALRLTGGVGDSLIALGGSAQAIKQKWPEAKVTVATRENQHDLLKQIVGVDDCISGADLNKLQVRNKFDIILDFQRCFATSREIRPGNYYQLVSDHLGIEVQPPVFKFSRSPEAVPKIFGNREVIAIHTGASNPNRRWPIEKWRTLSKAFIDRGFYLKFFGTWDEFSLSGDYCEAVCEASENLLYQAKQLAKASYFIGNDSGFAHIAGVLGIPGYVLFFATHPDDVIGHYPSLKGIHCFDRLEVKPTRSLSVTDPIALKAIEELSMEEVLDQTDFNAIDCTMEEQTMQEPSKPIIAVVTNGLLGKQLAEWLSQFYVIEVMKNIPLFIANYYAVLVVEGGECSLLTERRRVNVDISSLENVRRAIREVCVVQSIAQ